MISHGTRATYDKYKCRCAECVAAASKSRNSSRYALGTRIEGGQRGRRRSKDRAKILAAKARRKAERELGRKEKLNAYLASPNLCKNCSGPILPQEGERLYIVKRKRFCSQSCAGTFNRTGKGVPRSRCLNECGATVKGIHSKYCSQKCFRDKTYADYIAKWKMGKASGGTSNAEDYLANAVRRYILEKFSYKCCLCGWGEVNPHTKKVPLHVDHVDGNPTNNTEGNLRALCPNCHSLTSNYGALNKGSGRATRRAKDKKYFIAKLVEDSAEMAELAYAPLS